LNPKYNDSLICRGLIPKIAPMDGDHKSGDYLRAIKEKKIKEMMTSN
jgi:hypothetical protein